MDKVSVDHALQQLPQFHLSVHGMTDEQAELEFIKEAQKLQEYGIHFYKVQRRPAHVLSRKVSQPVLYYILKSCSCSPSDTFEWKY